MNAVVLYGEAAPKLAANGYKPVPVIPGQKKAFVNDWQHFTFDPADHRYDDCSVGILTGNVVALDIDVSNEELADQIETEAVTRFGAAPVRVGRAPRRVLMYRTEDTFAKIQGADFRLPTDAPDDKPQRVEVLAQGQQVVAFGIHPDIKKPYEWTTNSPLDVGRNVLPVVSRNQMDDFVHWCNELMGSVEGVTRAGKLRSADLDREHIPGEKLSAVNVPRTREQIKAIPNDDLSWDDYVYVGMAIKGALGISGEDAFIEWASKSNKYEKATTSHDWAQFKPTRIGAGTINHFARANGWTSPNDPRLLHIQSLDEFDDKPAPQWLVRGVAQLMDIGVMYGQPGSSKTFLALDLAMFLAQRSTDDAVPKWFDRRVQRGGVVYVTSEGNLSNRIRAYKLHHNNIGNDALANFGILQTNLNFVDERGIDIAALVADVKRKSAEVGGVVLIVLDTLNAMMIGDENSSEDMGMMVAAAKTLRDATKATVLYVHHCGKDEARGARGHSSLRAACDFEISVSRDKSGVRVAKISKVRDGETDQAVAYQLKVVDLGPSRDPFAEPGEIDRSCAVEQCDMPTEAAKGIELSAYDGMALEALKVVDSGNGALRKVWQASYVARCPTAKGDRTAQQARSKRFNKSVDALMLAGAVRLDLESEIFYLVADLF